MRDRQFGSTPATHWTKRRYLVIASRGQAMASEARPRALSEWTTWIARSDKADRGRSRGEPRRCCSPYGPRSGSYQRSIMLRASIRRAGFLWRRGLDHAVLPERRASHSPSHAFPRLLCGRRPSMRRQKPAESPPAMRAGPAGGGIASSHQSHETNSFARPPSVVDNRFGNRP